MRQKLKRPDRSRPVKTHGGLAERLSDEARFIRTWFENPLVMGAVSPSGRVLARAMARYVDPSVPGPIIELGPGTGPVTEALIRRGVAPERLVLVEFDRAFCKLLARRFAGARIVEGDAYDLRTTLAGMRIEAAAAVVSSLPLLIKPEAQRLALLADAFAQMRQDGVFVQFTYGMVSPMPKKARGVPMRGVTFECSPPVWLNLPPARVWVYRRAGNAVTPIRQRAHPLLDRIRQGTGKMQGEIKERTEKVKAEWRERTEKVRADLKRTTDKVRSGKHVKPALDLFEKLGERKRRRRG